MSKGIQNYPNATTERDNAYRRIDAMEQQIDGYRVTCDALRAQLAASEKLVEDMREKPEPLTTNDWRLLYLGHEAALLDLRAQLVIVEQERDAATEETRLAFVGHLDARAKAHLDAARGEAAGYREYYSAAISDLHLIRRDLEAIAEGEGDAQIIAQQALALVTPGKSISEWQAEAREAERIANSDVVQGLGPEFSEFFFGAQGEQVYLAGILQRVRGAAVDAERERRFRACEQTEAEAARLRAGGGK